MWTKPVGEGQILVTSALSGKVLLGYLDSYSDLLLVVDPFDSISIII